MKKIPTKRKFIRMVQTHGEVGGTQAQIEWLAAHIGELYDKIDKLERQVKPMVKVGRGRRVRNTTKWKRSQ